MASQEHLGATLVLGLGRTGEVALVPAHRAHRRRRGIKLDGCLERVGNPRVRKSVRRKRDSRRRTLARRVLAVLPRGANKRERDRYRSVIGAVGEGSVGRLGRVLGRAHLRHKLIVGIGVGSRAGL